MAGLFGFLNYEKPGPGVSKDLPEKHRFFLFFEIYFRKIWKLCILNLLYIVCCIPVITIGPATAGFFYVIRNFVQEKHAYVASDFFEVAKKNFLQAFLISVFDAVAIFLLYLSYDFWSDKAVIPSDFLRTMATTLVFVISAIFLFMHYYIFTLLVTFKFNLRQLYKNSFIFAVVGLGRNIIITIILAIIIFILYILNRANYVLIPLIMLSTIGFIVSFMSFPLIKKLMLDPIMEKERANVNKTEDEPVFKDDV